MSAASSLTVDTATAATGAGNEAATTDAKPSRRAQLAPSTTRAKAAKRASRANRPDASASAPDPELQKLSQQWCEVEMLLRVRIASQEDTDIVQRDAQASLMYLDRLAATAGKLGCSQGALSRLLLPFDTYVLLLLLLLLLF